MNLDALGAWLVDGRSISFSTGEYVDNHRLMTWPVGHRLALPIYEIWCQTSNGPLHRIEVLLNECEGDEFVFRRDPRIRAPIERTFVQSNSGIPVLAPEIVLLYKAKRAGEPKEQQDFSSTLDVLGSERRQWLVESIATIDPDHPWLNDLRGR